MTDITTTILPGPAQNIAAALASGFTIRNQSTTTAVWVSSNPNVSPGNGMKLSALGSLSWSGGPCYAVLDSTTGQATLSLSTSSSGVTDPVAIAQAVAAQGVPNVLTGGVLTPSRTSTTLSEYNVTQYASVAATVLFNAGSQGVLHVKHSAAGTDVYNKQYNIGSSTINTIQILTPCYGDTLDIIGANGVTLLDVVAYGSNRTSPDKCVTDTQMANSSHNQSYAANTVYTLQAFTTNGGWASLNFRCTPGLITAGFTVGFQYYDPGTNSLVFQQFANNKQFSIDDSGSNSTWFGNAVIPAGIIALAIQFDAACNGIIVAQCTLPTE